MIPVLTAAETEVIDRRSVERGTTVETLMERAGLAAAHVAAGLAGGAYGRRATIVCGKGNNGGDGLMAARHLARWGMAVDVFLLGDADTLGPPVDAKLSQLSLSGVGVREGSGERIARALDRADVAIDAIFGTGFRGLPEGQHLEAIRALNGGPAPVVAIDIPSGVEGDTGAVRGDAVSADVTVAMGAPKVGDILPPGSSHAGIVEIADIGIPSDLLRADVSLIEPADLRSWLPVRAEDAHKRSSGVVLVIGGSARMTGAPRLVAEGALRAGAGLVTIAVPEPILEVVQANALEPTFLGLPADADGSVSEDAWELLASELEGFDAVAIGPGLSRAPGAAALARRVILESTVPVVADADAVNAFAGRAAELAGRATAGVITPHTGEFGRLFGMPASEVLEDRLGFARKAATETAGVVLLKGPRTLVAGPDGQVLVNPTGGPSLATGGSGDVLTGIIAALVARGLDPVEAAAAGAYVHGRSGELAARGFGEGSMASDIARAVPAAVASVQEES
jgi:ADP-dependent NAD(P)H-hydrate dehydratase / NAD(P)H-hydrate epimerase